MNSKFLLASVAALVIATPALAQDEAPAVRSGARVEARVGLDDVVLSFDGDKGSKVGLAYGGEAGYDYVTSSGYLIGAYAGIEGATTKDCEGVGNAEACLKSGRNITVGARAGAVIGHGAAYIKGGYTNGRATASYRDFVTPANSFSEAGNLDGWHVGVGYEMNLSAHTYAKAEYVYTHYSTDNDFGADIGLHRHQGVVGFGYRF